MTRTTMTRTSMTRTFTSGMALSAALLSLGVSQAAQAQAGPYGTVLGGYLTSTDVNQDRMTIIINNLTTTDFTDVTLSYLLPADSSGPAVTGSYDYGTVAANQSLTLDLSLLDPFGSNPAQTLPFIAPFDVTVTAQDGAASLFTTFNQDRNASGGFVGFEGIGEPGHDPYLPVTPTTVGEFAAVPEASTTVSLGMLMLGLGGLALRARRRA